MIMVFSKHYNEEKNMKKYRILVVFLMLFAYSFGYGVNFEDRYSESYKNALKVYDENKEKGVLLIQQLAKEGDSYAQGYLGELYNYGYGVEKNKTIAEVWYRKSAAQNNPMGMYGIGLIYKFKNYDLFAGPKNKKDRLKVLKWYKKSASFEYAPAAMGLATLYYKLDKKHYDPEKSKYWAEKYALWGTTYDKYYIGIKFRDEIWFPKDMKKSNYWLKKSYEKYFLNADRGDAYSQEMIGHMSYYGLGTSKNIQRAIKYLEFSLRNKDTISCRDATRLLEKIEKESSYNNDRKKKVDKIFGIKLGDKVTNITDKPFPVNNGIGLTETMSIDTPVQASALGFNGTTIGITAFTKHISFLHVYTLKKNDKHKNKKIFYKVKKLLKKKYGVFLCNYSTADKIEYSKTIGDITITIVFLAKKGVTLNYKSAFYTKQQTKEMNKYFNEKDDGL